MFNKFTLLAASTAIGMIPAVNAYAATNTYPTAQIQGNGASSIVNVLNQTENCFGNVPNKPAGFNDGTTVTVPDHVYTPVSPTTGNPVYNCGTQTAQDGVTAIYVSTGSGGGKNSWKNKNTSGITNNPFTFATNASTGLKNIHYAFSDSALAAADITTYNSAAAPTTGAAIQIPMYVLPVAVAYAPTYGKLNNGTSIVPLAFNLKFPRANATGGLRMKKSTYCAIFNGTITNWNDPALQADNGGQSLMDPADNATRWSTTGVPIVLVGRLDNSGTTNIFTRALTAQCPGTNFTAGGSDQLPSAVKSTAVYGQNTGTLTSGAEVAGKFGLVTGSDGINTTVGITVADPVGAGNVTLNGRLGYVGADWVAPATLTGAVLKSADLQSGTTTKFVSPDAVNATLAFKGILPPQSLSTGKYSATSTAVGQMPGLRSDPLAWVFPASVAGNPLANPAAGYPLTGTTNMLLYTCYADPAVRNAIVGLASLNLGKLTIADDGTKVPAKLVTSTAKDAAGLPLGVLARNGIATLPSTFVNAIYETFLTKTTSGNNPSALNLWIQSKQQTKTTDVITQNTSCTAGVGA